MVVVSAELGYTWCFVGRNAYVWVLPYTVRGTYKCVGGRVNEGEIGWRNGGKSK